MDTNPCSEPLADVLQGETVGHHGRREHTFEFGGIEEKEERS